jgi:hypothetical protein
MTMTRGAPSPLKALGVAWPSRARAGFAQTDHVQGKKPLVLAGPVDSLVPDRLDTGQVAHGRVVVPVVFGQLRLLESRSAGHRP